MQIVKEVCQRVNYILLSLFVWGMVVTPAWAVGGVAERSAEQVSTKLVEVLKDIIQPIGSLVIFAVVAFTAFKLITTAHKPDERAQAMGSLPYILGGGIALGAVMLLSGFIVGLMMKVGQ